MRKMALYMASAAVFRCLFMRQMPGIPICLPCRCPAARVGGALDKDAWKAFSKEHKPVQNVKNEGNIVAMHLAANNNVDKLCENFNQSLDALIGFLMANGYTKVCQFCGQEIDTEPYYVE